MTNHAIEIADARFWEKHGRYAPDMAQIEAIEAAGEARAAQVAKQPREAIIRLVSGHGRYVSFHVTVNSDRPKVELDDPRPPVAAILVWAAGTCMWVCAALAAYAVWG